MKKGREHIVPLSQPAMAILKRLHNSAIGNPFVFAGERKDRPISDKVMYRYLRKKEDVATVHGMRSTFRDWAGDMTDAARETAEACVAHTVGNATENAYRRQDALLKRRKLMDQWAEWCGQIG